MATVLLPYLIFYWQLYVGSETLIMLAVVSLIALFTLFLLEETLDKDMDELQVHLLVSKQNSIANLSEENGDSDIVSIKI